MSCQTCSDETLPATRFWIQEMRFVRCSVRGSGAGSLSIGTTAEIGGNEKG